MYRFKVKAALLVAAISACALVAAAVGLAGASTAPAAKAAAAGAESASEVRWVAASELAVPEASAGAAAGNTGWAGNGKRSWMAPRVVGGQPTTTGEWPWQVAITLNGALHGGSDFARQFCGGSLVATQVVITAAHCFYDDWAGGFAPPDHGFGPEFTVVAGRTTLSGSGGEEINVSDYYVVVDEAGNPRYDPATGKWDVLFLELAASSAQQQISLAGPGEDPVWAAGEDAYVTGWGTTSEGGLRSDTLREARVSILADDLCGNYGNRYKPALMLCAGVLAGGVDTCQGDSGGPAMAPIVGGGFRLMGLTSWGHGCARRGYPGVYTRIASDPIRSALAEGIQEHFGVNVLGSGAQPAPDTTPPEALITAGPKPRTTNRRASFGFLSNEPEASFGCSLDGSPYTGCVPTKTYRGLSLGGHVFRVRATDGHTNTGAPAKHAFRVVRK